MKTPNIDAFRGDSIRDRDNTGYTLADSSATLASVVGEKDSSLAGLQYLRGDVLARLGRFEEAEQAFREEIRLFPE